MNSEQAVSPIKFSPMMEQYLSIKKNISPDTILFFRLGDFYEMFFEDAVRASEILNITLTGREAGEAGRVSMCGVPYHAFQGYVKILVDHNLKVAICEQVSDPKPGKGIVDRKITRIISPATYLEDESRNAKPDYMLALARDGGDYALAYLELSTGEFMIRRSIEDKLLQDLSVLDPRELILPRALAQCEKFSEFCKTDLNTGITAYDEWVFDAQEAKRLLQVTFKLSSVSQLPFSHDPLLMGAAGAVLYYLRDHLHTSLEHLRLPQEIHENEFMILDRQTQRSLELAANLRQEKNGITLLSVMDQTLTSMGTRTLHQWLIQPLIDLEKIQARQNAVEELSKSWDVLNPIRVLLRGIRDMERTLSRLNCSVAHARDLVNLKQFLQRIPELKGLLQTVSSQLLGSVHSQLQNFPELIELISRAIQDEPPLALKEGGIIQDGFSLELDELRAISRKGKEWLLEFERCEIERTGIRSLKIKYSQVFGYTIDISKSNLHLVPPDYVRKQTLANAERFILPELNEWDQKISGAQDKIKLLEYQLFNEVRETVLKSLEPLQRMARAIGTLDALTSLSVIAIQKHWVKPEVVDTEELWIEAGRHPVVESMLPTGQFVENDSRLNRDDHQLIVLTGPNMAGKSTYIRQVAQIVLLAQMGSFVPAKSARIGVVDRIFTRIGAADDLARGESTFMVEMLETAHILHSASNRSLLILDEVGRGTSTFDGVSIAWAICEHLAGGKLCPRTLFATHYHELTQLEEHFKSVKNYHIAVRETPEGIIFLRKVIRGGADRSYGIHVAKLAGIPGEVITRAHEILAVLEAENVQASDFLDKKGTVKKGKKPELPSLFDLPKENHPVVEALRNLNLDQMTPLQALNKLQELKEKSN
ncbi:MAG: DNA mismatch repair protein MutS [Candidatus Omnitrophica bacterium]|nr:DNA mismatch repair protein MutS [Candidatus Omnitrophota bacterium]